MMHRGSVWVAGVLAVGAVAVTATATEGVVAVGVALMIGAALGAWWFGEQRQRRALLRRLGTENTGPRTAAGVSWARLLDAADEAAVAREDARDARADGSQLEPWRLRLVTSIEGPALLFSADERLVAANDAARDLLGVPDLAPGPDPTPDLLLAQALGSASIANAAREAVALGRPVQVDAEVRGRDLRATASAVAGEVLVIVADRTEQRRVEELRRNFVVNASHELKTPATSIQALTEALHVVVEDASPRARALMDRLQEESDRLVRLVHDLLDLRRMEDPGPLERVPVDLVQVVRRVVADLVPAAAEAGIDLTSDLPDSANLAGVPEDLHVAVHNLVANAVRYNQPGGQVEVVLRREGGEHVLLVRDTGIGIPHGELQRVFERFYRVDVARSRERGGTGLGLSLVRNAVERHGGVVTADSLLGTGSTFTVRLPIEPRP